jgi:hypothetical protein
VCNCNDYDFLRMAKVDGEIRKSLEKIASHLTWSGIALG